MDYFSSELKILIKRGQKEFEEDILQGLQWAGDKYDQEPVRQSERSELYREAKLKN